ncbi:MAG: bifunctional 5,10-methylene-tetrahydrofolate dehydrogenase/5,10-methylene-tetrahydrofolate cyclohydrolase, partial [Flavobacteriales bacterium]|nr:bifunctional 5,10-methylene-tetrahydrofolate dehydrogenase/5,10-methylene-tetrahydrofolate cyclohydrolase [Flavobacteriales bacterium]
MKILDGNKVATEIKNEIAQSVIRNLKLNKRPPHLAAILVGENGASETYVAAKVKACEKVGFVSSLIRFKENISQEKLLKKIEEINCNDDIDGLIVQLPLPKHINE